MFQIDLAASGELNLYLPGGRAVEIPASPTGLEYIKKVLYEYKRGIKDQPGYIGALPTQHAVEKFLKDKRARIAKEKAEEAKTKANKLGIDLSKIEIKL